MITDFSGRQVEAYVLHLPGKGKRYLGRVLDKEKENMIVVSDAISIITTATPDTLESCPFIYQLNHSNVFYLNSAKDFFGEWHKIDKLHLILESLSNADKEYSLVMDANDTVILRDIDEEFIEKFKSFDCDVVFNGSQYLYPKEAIPLVLERENSSPFVNHYLNAGVCFGRTEAVRALYEKALFHTTYGLYPPYDSEQYYIRIAIAECPNVKCKIDDGSRLFLVSHGN